MTTLKTGYNTANRANFAAIQNHLYVTNNFDRPQVWNGIDSVTRDAGIAGPAAAPNTPTEAAGNCTIGPHRIRYRYRNSKTGYVSNPSPALEYTITSGQLTFTGGGTDYVNSTDAKVDTVDIEMTTKNGQIFYRAASGLNSAASIVVNLADTSLIQQFNCDDEYGASETLDVFSHEQPPLGTIAVAYKSRMWVLGDAAYAISATFTNGSNLVAGTGFSPDWEGFLVRDASNTVAYRITDATTTQLTLSENWVGSTGLKTASVYSPTPNQAYYSRLGYPESFYRGVFARDMLNGRSDKLVGCWGRPNGLYFFGSFSADRLAFNTDPSAASSSIYSIDGDRGVFNQRCLVELEGQLMAFDRQGIWRVDAQPDHLSSAVDDVLSTMVDYSASTKFHAAFDPRDRVALFFFVATGDTQPKYAAAFDLDGQRWGIFHFKQGVTASKIVPTSDGQVRLQLCDENGYSWFFGIEGSFDGVPPGTSAIGTATGTPTTTVVDVSETLGTSPNLVGVPVYDATSGETRIVSANTANQFTVGVAWGSAPPAGRVFYFGAIDFEYRSKWWNSYGAKAKIRPTYFLMSIYPGSATGKVRVYYYLDYSATPQTLTSITEDQFPDGVTIVNGGTYLEVDLDGGNGDGFIPVPMIAEWSRGIQVRLTSDRPDGDLRLMDFQFAVKNGDAYEVIGE